MKEKLPQVKKIIAVGSGKGGVGKSTTAVNLALALQQLGHKVGVVDADIYGPNQPKMLGVSARAESKDQKTIEPIMAHGLQTMSIAYLIDDKKPMVWRGPMAGKALQQLVFQTNWEALDFLIVDLPPGTGDIQLTLAQKVPIDGALIVTTPQDVALLDVEKAIVMFQKVDVPVLGIVENMSMHTCSECGHQEAIFGEAGGDKLAKEYQLKLLGKLPLDITIRQQADDGNPTVIADPSSKNSQLYISLAESLLAALPKDDYLFRS